MKVLTILFLSVCLSLSPFATFAKDTKKYTTEHNTSVLSSISKEIYTFVASLEKLESNWTNRRHILVNIFDIIDKYNCNGKLYIINRGLNIRTIDDKIAGLLVTLFVMNSLDLLDTVLLKFDIASVKKGDPIKIHKQRIET